MSDVEKRDLSLGECGLFTAEQVERLHDRWVRTLEELLALGASGAWRRLVAELFGLDLAGFDALFGQACAMAPGVAAAAGTVPEPRSMGCLRPTSPPTVAALPVAIAEVSLPAQANLIARLAPVRDQGGRGTCVAFGSAAVREFLTGRRDVDLSEQFLYWACKERDGHPGPGTLVSVGFECLLTDGVCLEDQWPYNPEGTDDEGQGPPPPGAVDAATRHTLAEAHCLVSNPDGPVSVEPFKAYLGGQAPRPITFGVPLFDSFFNQATWRTGRVPMPFPGEGLRGGHAMCMAGYQDDDEAPGGGFFLVRNSWGEGWAAECACGAGHALQPYQYIEEYCWEAYTGTAEPLAEERPDAEQRPQAAEVQTGQAFCGACGKRLTTALDQAGRCTHPGCAQILCNTCWTVRRLRRCRAHGGASE